MNANRKNPLLLAALSLALTVPATCADVFTFSGAAAGTYDWTAGTGWDATPVSGSETYLIYNSTLDDGVVIVSNNDVASAPFRIYEMDFINVGPASGTAPTLTLEGGELEFNSASFGLPRLIFATTGTVQPKIVVKNDLWTGRPFLVVADTDATLRGDISGNSLSKYGLGTLILSGNNSYGGYTELVDGTLTLGSSTALPDDTPIVIGSVTLHAATTGVEDTGALLVTGTATINLAAGAQIEFDASNGSDWTGGTLNITGTFISGSSLRFGNSGGLDSTQLSKIFSAGYAGFALNGSGYLTATAVGPTYTAWAASKGLTGAPGFENGKAADPDNDGRNNLSEFALDGNPLSGANDSKVIGKVVTVNGSEVLTLTLPVRNLANFPAGSGDRVSDFIDGIVYRIEGDVNLSTFGDTISEVTPVLNAGLPVLSTGWTYRTFRAPGTVQTVPKAFLRATISETP